MAGIGTRMEVDPPTSTSIATAASESPFLALCTFGAGTNTRDSPPSVQTGLHPLKRSNSAPMINVLVACTTTTTTSTCSSSTAAVSIPRPSTSQTAHEPSRHAERVRRYSVSSAYMHSPTTPIKAPSRLDQIKKEETVTVRDREAAHEREVQSTMQMSQSWEELTIDDHMMTEQKRPKSFGEPLHVFTSHYPYASSPSPTRVGKQCFSPSLQLPIRAGTLTPSPSPSPTRKTFARRSLSPITLRPSPLGGALKRKMEVENTEKFENYFSPPKRVHLNTSPSGNSTPDRLAVLNHPLIHSISSSSLEDTSSPEQTVPFVPTITSASSTATSASSPASCFSFRPVRDSVDTHGTDSETSDMTETTDISEHSESTHMAEGHCSMSTDAVYKHGT